LDRDRIQTNEESHSGLFMSMDLENNRIYVGDFVGDRELLSH
jgi:hypothetical protein